MSSEDNSVSELPHEGAGDDRADEMTMRYAHLAPDVRRSAVQMLDRHGNTVATQAVPEARCRCLQ